MFVMLFLICATVHLYVTKASCLTLVLHGKASGLLGSVRIEVKNDKVGADVGGVPWWVSGIKAGHHLVVVAIQHLNHVCPVRDIEEGKVKEDGLRSWHLDGPVAGTTWLVMVREVRRVQNR